MFLASFPFRVSVAAAVGATRRLGVVSQAPASARWPRLRYFGLPAGRRLSGSSGSASRGIRGCKSGARGHPPLELCPPGRLGGQDVGMGMVGNAERVQHVSRELSQAVARHSPRALSSRSRRVLWAVPAGPQDTHVIGMDKWFPRRL